jgi:hypothetical protein
MGLDYIMSKDRQVQELSRELNQVKDALNSENKKYVLVEASSNDSRTVVRVFEGGIKGWFKYARHYVLNLFNSDVKTYVKDDAANYLLVNMDKNIKEITSAFASSKKITKDFGERFQLFSQVEKDLRECLDVQTAFARNFKTSDKTQKTPDVFTSDEPLREMNDVFNGNLTSWENKKESATIVFDRINDNLKIIKQAANKDNLPHILDALISLISDRKNYNIHFEGQFAQEIDEAIDAKLLELLPDVISELDAAKETNDLQRIQIAYESAHRALDHSAIKELYDKAIKSDDLKAKLGEKTTFTKFCTAFENGQDTLKTASVGILKKLQTAVNDDLAKMKATKEENDKTINTEKHKLWLANDALRQIDELGSSSLFNDKDVEAEVDPKINLLKDLLNHYAKLGEGPERKMLGERISTAMQKLGLVTTPEERAKGLWPITGLLDMCTKLQVKADENIKRLETSIDESPDFAVPGLKSGRRLIIEQDQWVMLKAIATKSKEIIASMKIKSLALSVKVLESQAKQSEVWDRQIGDFERQIGALEGMKKSAIEGRLRPDELDKAILWAQGRLK